MIAYYCTSDEERAVVELRGLGWIEIARYRFVTPAKDEVRVVSRAGSLVPLGGRTPMVKGLGYDDAGEKWQAERDGFERMTTEGNGYWVDMPA